MRGTIAVLALAGSLLAAPAVGSREVGAGVILFWTDRGLPALWSMRPDGSDRHLIYRTSQNAKRPVLSPDGHRIVFDGASPGKAPMSDFDLQVVGTDGKGRRTLAGSRATEIDGRWSPRGAWISFSRWSPTADWRTSWIWLVRPDGTGLRRLGRGHSARWSPDGGHLVIDAPTAGSDGDLFVVDLKGGRRRQLTRTAVLEQPAGWSPDGRILFTRFAADGSGHSDVYSMSSTGTRVRRLTHSGARNEAAAWSPDGSQVLFTSDRTGHPQVWVMATDGTRSRNLSHNSFANEATSWR